MISRREMLAATAALAAATPAQALGAQTLAAAASRAGLIFGASIDRNAFGNAAYGKLYVKETQLLATDVAMKFDVIRPAQDVWDFGPADEILAFAQANKKLVRGVALIWNDYPAPWLKQLSLAELRRVFDEHIDRVASRYAGRLHSWDVVNEPFWPMDGKPGGWRDGPWYQAFGPDYVDRAFRRVAAVDPAAKLALNEAQCDNDYDWGNQIRPLLRGLVTDLLQKGTPIAAVGLQSHLQPKFPHNYQNFAGFVDSFAANALEVHLTELDVNDESLPDSIVLRDRSVATLASQYLTAVLASRAVKVVNVWQLSDRYSWYQEEWRKAHPYSRRQPRPLPYDLNLRAKSMRTAMLRAFGARKAPA